MTKKRTEKPKKILMWTVLQAVKVHYNKEALKEEIPKLKKFCEKADSIKEAFTAIKNCSIHVYIMWIEVLHHCVPSINL